MTISTRPKTILYTLHHGVENFINLECVNKLSNNKECMSCLYIYIYMCLCVRRLCDLEEMESLGLCIPDLNMFDSSRDMVMAGWHHASRLEYSIEKVCKTHQNVILINSWTAIMPSWSVIRSQHDLFVSLLRNIAEMPFCV